MSISLDDLKSILQQHQVQNEVAQLKLIVAPTQKLCIQVPPHLIQTNSTSEFNYNSICGLVSDAWCKPYEDVFCIECSASDDAAKVRPLLQEIGTVEHNRYVSFILPKKPSELSFDETVTVSSRNSG
ncbi:unnamed protein product [Trichobilharzia regenti]|nr:unnamed protein product [Trichobilharzia regenti]